MAYNLFACESCSLEIAVDSKVKEKPLACPRCRGMLVLDRRVEETEGTKVDCPVCGSSFVTKQPPFKCAFCDHSFPQRFGYF